MAGASPQWLLLEQLSFFERLRFAAALYFVSSTQYLETPVR
jgi:hypothetical protein